MHKEIPPGVTTVAGSWTANSVSINGICKQIFIDALGANTYFDFSLTDNDDLVIFSRESVHSCLNELVELPMSGIYTMTIANATANEAFDVKLVVQTIS